MYRLIALLIGYAFGCLQNGYFLSKKTAGIDIRDYGSGGAGMTNVTRILGVRLGAVVLAADMTKAAAAFLLAAFIFNGSLFGWQGDLHPGLYAGLGVVLGHDFPFYMRFRGGKGVASTLGLILLLDWRVALIVYAVVLAIALIVKYISVASLFMSLLIPALLAAFGHGWEVITVTSLLGALAWFMHRGNITRLIKNTESKFSLSGGKKIPPSSTVFPPPLPSPVPPLSPSPSPLNLPFTPNSSLLTLNSPLPPPNKGKSLEIEVKGKRYARIPIRTHIITQEDSAESVFTPYLSPHLYADDIVFISERAVACTQARAIPMSEIKPRRLAVFLSRHVHKTPHGIGLGIPETMEMALRECGVIRILFAAFVSVIGKLFGRKGWFYLVAGEKARGIDGPCDNTIPPYNHYVVLAPSAPGKTAQAIAENLGVHTVIVDANDLGVNLMGTSDPRMGEAFIAAVLRDNPMGQSSEQTPCGIIREIGRMD